MSENIYSKENFVTWLGEQPASKSYTYAAPLDCAVSQYFKANGMTGFETISGPVLEKELGWHHIVIGFPHTFGAAYIRGRGGFLAHYWKKWNGR